MQQLYGFWENCKEQDVFGEGTVFIANCYNCKEKVILIEGTPKYKYCPYCGAKMSGNGESVRGNRSKEIEVII